jgi:hypothetical protein
MFSGRRHETSVESALAALLGRAQERAAGNRRYSQKSLYIKGG